MKGATAPGRAPLLCALWLATSAQTHPEPSHPPASKVPAPAVGGALPSSGASPERERGPKSAGDEPAKSHKGQQPQNEQATEGQKRAAQASDVRPDAGKAAQTDAAAEAPEDAQTDAGTEAAPTARARGAVADLPPELHPELNIKLTPNDELHVGEALKLTLEASAPSGTRISVPKRSLAPFEVLKRDSRTEPLPDGRERHVFELELITFDPGEVELPSLELRLVTPDQQVGAVHTEPRKLRVRSWLANEPEAKPQGATAPVTVMEDDYTLAWIGAGLLTAMSLLGLGFWFARWFARRTKSEPPPPPARPPWEIAHDELKRLERQRPNWLEEGRGSEYVDRLSDIIRQYLGRRYGFDGLESTTDEVVAELQRRRSRELPLTDVVTLLQDCDLVKFAKADPDVAMCDALHEQARSMVERTTPTHSPDSEAAVELAEEGGA